MTEPGAKEGLGVGDTCDVAGCGHRESDHRPTTVNSIPTIWCHGCASAVPRLAVKKNGEAAYDHCEHAFKPAPPSAPVRPPEPIPDQVLTPLSAAFETLLSESQRLARASADDCGCGDCGWCDLADEWDAVASRYRAALAGVPKEAGDAVCECGHGSFAHRSPPWDFGLPYGDYCEECQFVTGYDYRHSFKPGVVAAPVEDAK